MSQILDCPKKDMSSQLDNNQQSSYKYEINTKSSKMEPKENAEKQIYDTK